MAVQMVSKLLGEGIRPGTGQSEVFVAPVTPGMIGVICFHRAQVWVPQCLHFSCVQKPNDLLVSASGLQA